MPSGEKYLDILDINYNVLFRIRLRDNSSGASKETGKSSATQKKTASNPEEKMTDAQRKFLFRLYAQKGITGDTAHKQLKELFGVAGLDDVSKLEASRKIESLLTEVKGGNGNGSFIQ